MPRFMNLAFASGWRAQTAVWLILVCGLLLSKAAAQQGSMAGVRVLPENLVFAGNKAFSTDELRSIFRSAGTVTADVPPQFLDTYNNDRILHALNTLLRFYQNRGFVKAVISEPEVDFGPAGSDGKMTVVVKITENNAYQLGQIRIASVTALREAVVVSMLNLQPKSVVNLSKISAGILALRETYLTLGYLDVDIRSSLDAPDGKRIADLRLEIIEGNQYHVGRVEFVGNSPIRAQLLREMLPFQSGDIFGRKAFDACLETLNEVGITPVLTIEDVDFNYEKSKALVDVAIHLAGKKKRAAGTDER
jgi:outer membrane protein assembly factor BamA